MTSLNISAIKKQLNVLQTIYQNVEINYITIK